MRILFITPETPIFPAGGIGVYFHYVVPALEAAGHEVYLLTWRASEEFIPPESLAPFHPDRVRIELFSLQEAMLAGAPRPYCQVMSELLADKVVELAESWQIDVIESVDFHAPGLTAFQKLQSSAAGAGRLLVTFNHGLHEVIHEANQSRPDEPEQASIVAERRLLAVSDLVIAPSQAALRMCRALGVSSPVSVVREPYLFRNPANAADPPTHNIQFQGRLSVQKGMDRLSLVANVINSVVPVGRIDVIGSARAVAFGGQGSLDLLRGRLDNGLAERLVHHDQLPRDQALGLLEAGAFGPHLGTNETFSYACVEAIDAGLIPLVHTGNAMFEFLPPDLTGFALDARMQSLSAMRATIERILKEAGPLRQAIRAHCQETLDPALIAASLSDVYAQALAAKRGRRVHASAQPPLGTGDMSLLVPVCDAHPLRLAETLASIAAQGRAQPHVILCLDGEKAVFGPQVRKALAGLPGARVIGQVRAGEPAALNTLAECCTTALAMVLRPGQRLASGAVQRLLERWNALDQGIDALIVPETVSCRQDPLAHGHLPAALAARLDELRGETALLRSSVLRTVGYETVRRNGERIDWAFWLRFDAEGYRAAFLPETDLVSAGVPLPAPTTAALLGTQVMVRDIATPNPPG